jgi:GNAT superfamily N-acetyltransferase
MLESTCACEAVLTGEDLDALVADGVEHYGSVHPELGLNETSIRNYFEAEARLDGPTGRLDEIGEITIRRIEPALKEDVIEFFDRRAFAGNPQWAMCYCMFHHVGGRYAGEWPKRTWQDNRADLSLRIDNGTTTGVVAYVGGRLAGWCNATARSAFPSLTDGEDDEVGSIVCFVVAPPYRGHGVARSLLDGALDLLSDLGRTVAEAYPVVGARSSASAYVGTLQLYQDAGFDVTSQEPLVVRKSLT